MRYVAISSGLTDEIRGLFSIAVKDDKQPGDIREWEDSLKALKPKLYEAYRSAITNKLIEWRVELVPYHGLGSRSWSVNSYRAGLKGDDAAIKHPAHVLRETNSKTQAQKAKEKIDEYKYTKVLSREQGFYKRLRYLYKFNSTKLSDWDRQFITSLGNQLTEGRPSTLKQKQIASKLFEKYKVPEGAEATTMRKTTIRHTKSNKSKTTAVDMDTEYKMLKALNKFAGKDIRFKDMIKLEFRGETDHIEIFSHPLNFNVSINTSELLHKFKVHPGAFLTFLYYNGAQNNDPQNLKAYVPYSFRRKGVKAFKGPSKWVHDSAGFWKQIPLNPEDEDFESIEVE
jgi:hypothetical protein